MAVKLLNIKHVKTLKIAFTILAVFALAMIVYFPNYAKLKQLRQANSKLVSDIGELDYEIVDLQLKLGTIGEDSQIYEKVARDELGVVREGEIVIDIER